MVASFSIPARFMAKIELVFVLSQENAFFFFFHFKANRKSIGLFKIRIFKIALHMRDRHAFM